MMMMMDTEYCGRADEAWRKYFLHVRQQRKHNRDSIVEVHRCCSFVPDYYYCKHHRRLLVAGANQIQNVVVPVLLSLLLTPVFEQDFEGQWTTGTHIICAQERRLR